MTHTTNLKIPSLTSICLLGIAILTFQACKTGTQRDKQGSKTINVNEVTLSPVRHDTLSSEQLKSIKEIQETFAEVNPSSLEETITNFKRDLHPENEISIWQSMALAYEKYTSMKGKELDLKSKTEAYRLILMRSMMTEEEARIKSEIKLLSDKDIQAIFSFYNQTPKPITIEK